MCVPHWSVASSGSFGSDRLTLPKVFLETPRITLRRLMSSDVEELVELDSDPCVMRYLTGGEPHTRALLVEQFLPRMLDFYRRFDAFGFWAAIEIASGGFMGWFHFKPSDENADDIELGYRLKRAYWDRGLATEGSKALIDEGFRELGVSKVVAETMASNVRSRRVLEKCGFLLERAFAYPGPPFPGWTPGDCMEVAYGLTRERWESLTS